MCDQSPQLSYSKSITDIIIFCYQTQKHTRCSCMSFLNASTYNLKWDIGNKNKVIAQWLKQFNSNPKVMSSIESILITYGGKFGNPKFSVITANGIFAFMYRCYKLHCYQREKGGAHFHAKHSCYHISHEKFLKFLLFYCYNLIGPPPPSSKEG